MQKNQRKYSNRKTELIYVVVIVQPKKWSTETFGDFFSLFKKHLPFRPCNNSYLLEFFSNEETIRQFFLSPKISVRMSPHSLNLEFESGRSPKVNSNLEELSTRLIKRQVFIIFLLLFVTKQ